MRARAKGNLAWAAKHFDNIVRSIVIPEGVGSVTMGFGQVKGLLLGDTAVYRCLVEPATQYIALPDQLDLFRREFTRCISDNVPEGQGCLRRREAART